MSDMTDKQVVSHLREWVKHSYGPFAWPTDACGYEQHIRFVRFRNARINGDSPENLKTTTGGFDLSAIVLEYADKLERGEILPYSAGGSR